MAIKLFSESSALPGIYRNILAYDLSLIRNQCSRDQSYKKPPTLVELSKCAWHGAQYQRANASSFPQESLVRYWVSRLLPPEPVSVPLPLRCPGLLPLTHALLGQAKAMGQGPPSQLGKSNWPSSLRQTLLISHRLTSRSPPAVTPGASLYSLVQLPGCLQGCALVGHTGYRCWWLSTMNPGPWTAVGVIQVHGPPQGSPFLGGIW